MNDRHQYANILYAGLAQLTEYTTKDYRRAWYEIRMERLRVQQIFQAMGDGNHSLATAKAAWEEIKKDLSVDEIETIRKTMKAYLEDGTLQTLEPGCMLVRREAEGRSRLGLVISVDLESYDYNKGSQSLIRATEGTVVERIPPRLRIRRGAPLEMPHIMILIDDPDHTVIEPLEDLDLETIYDTDLMQGGGHVTGKFVPEKKLDGMKEALGKLMDQAIERYGEGHVIFRSSRRWETAIIRLQRRRLHGKKSRKI